MRYWLKIKKRIEKKLQSNGEYVGGELVWALDVRHLALNYDKKYQILGVTTSKTQLRLANKYATNSYKVCEKDMKEWLEQDYEFPFCCVDHSPIYMFTPWANKLANYDWLIFPHPLENW